MKYFNDCPFCKNTRFKNNELINIDTINSIIFENDNLYIQVDISPLCRGHILIVTNKHYLNFYETSKNIKDDVIKLKDKIREIYKEIYNSDVLFFEHGSSMSGYAGSSIDHAHIHAIPFNYDFNNDLNLGREINCDIFKTFNFHNEFSYIYLENSNKNIIYKVEKLPSQFMRKVVSDKLKLDGYLWQDRCMSISSKNTFTETINDLKGKIII